MWINEYANPRVDYSTIVQGRVRYQLKTAYRDVATGPRSLLATPITAIEVWTTSR